MSRSTVTTSTVSLICLLPAARQPSAQSQQDQKKEGGRGVDAVDVAEGVEDSGEGEGALAHAQPHRHRPPLPRPPSARRHGAREADREGSGVEVEVRSVRARLQPVQLPLRCKLPRTHPNASCAQLLGRKVVREDEGARTWLLGGQCWGEAAAPSRAQPSSSASHHDASAPPPAITCPAQAVSGEGEGARSERKESGRGAPRGGGRGQRGGRCQRCCAAPRPRRPR